MEWPKLHPDCASITSPREKVSIRSCSCTASRRRGGSGIASSHAWLKQISGLLRPTTGERATPLGHEPDTTSAPWRATFTPSCDNTCESNNQSSWWVTISVSWWLMPLHVGDSSLHRNCRSDQPAPQRSMKRLTIALTQFRRWLMAGGRESSR
jgi:hypothetical protein